MRLESVAKFHSPKSPMMSDSPRATASDSLSGTDVMAAMGMAQSQAGFGMAAFCGKHELSQNDKQKAINYLMQFAHKVSGKYRGVAKLEGNTKAKVLQVLATFAYADYCRSAATPGARCRDCHGTGRAVDIAKTEQWGRVVEKECGRCKGVGYSRMPAKGIETAVNNATASSNSANSMSALAQQFRAEKPTTGLFGNAQNMFAKLTGSDTTLRDLRIRQNALVNSQVLKFLPPGPATDKDVEIVRQGAPTDMDNPETVARWLDAMANLERRNAQFNEFKAEWMSANGNPGQSRNGGQILGLDVKKGESLGSAVKRYMSMNTDAAPAQDSTPSGEPRNQVGSYTSKSGIQFTVE
ncbi:TPA: antitermination protein [Escherichia coli]